MSRLLLIRENFGEQDYEEVDNYDLWIDLLLQGHKGYQEGNTGIEYTMDEPNRYTRTDHNGYIEDDNVRLVDSFSHLYNAAFGMWIVRKNLILIGGE